LNANETNIGDLSITAIAQNCPKLKSICIAINNFVTDVSMCLLARNCNQMRDLDLENCSLLTDKSFACFAEFCPKLERITINSCDITEFSLYELLEHCKHIVHLEADEAITTGVMLKGVKNAKSVEFLTFLDNNKYLHFQRDFKRNVNELSLPAVTYCSGDSGADFSQHLNTVAYLCPELLEFNYQGGSDIDMAIQMPIFFSFCPHLLVVKLKNAIYVAGTINSIANTCVNITTLHLFCVKLQIGDEITNLVTLRGKTLTNLSFVGCTGIDHYAIKSVIENCVDLNYLDLSGITTSVIGFVVLDIFIKCKKLRFLGLNNLPNLTENISKLVPKNRYITVQQDANATSTGLMADEEVS
jgi:hypothetical protein